MIWYKLGEKTPKAKEPILVYLPGEGVREGYMTEDGAWFAGGLGRDAVEVAGWADMPTVHAAELEQPVTMERQELLAELKKKYDAGYLKGYAAGLLDARENRVFCRANT